MVPMLTLNGALSLSNRDRIPNKNIVSREEVSNESLQQSGNVGSGTPSAEVAISIEASIGDSLPDKVEEEKQEPQDTALTENQEPADSNIPTTEIGQSKLAEHCPFCTSKDFIKRGTRKNKHQIVQLYECKNVECGKTFTAQDVKGKHFPLNVIIEGMSYYNLGFTLEETCSLLKQKFGVNPEPSTLSEWISQYDSLCRYSRLRPYATKMFTPQNVVEVVTMAHRQLYRFRYHRAKTMLMLEEEYRNRRLQPLKEFLDNISSVTPHQYFSAAGGQDSCRMSEIRSKLDKSDMLVKSKFNYANRLADFVLQAVKDNKQRHEQLQRFFIANDSVTVATEVPVYIRKEDVVHMENDLGFKISDDGNIELKGHKNPVAIPKLLTGHIDLIQVRNGQVHLLDYKPGASKEKPIEQLTWYALAMCRLTGLRLYDFTCAWFDEKDFYQFYPLHVVKKLKTPTKKKRKIFFKDGTWGEAGKKNELVIVDRNDTDYGLKAAFRGSLGRLPSILVTDELQKIEKYRQTKKHI